jgi:hypothetical protein
MPETKPAHQLSAGDIVEVDGAHYRLDVINQRSDDHVIASGYTRGGLWSNIEQLVRHRFEGDVEVIKDWRQP